MKKSITKISNFLNKNNRKWEKIFIIFFLTFGAVPFVLALISFSQPIALVFAWLINICILMLNCVHNENMEEKKEKHYFFIWALFYFISGSMLFIPNIIGFSCFIIILIIYIVYISKVSNRNFAFAIIPYLLFLTLAIFSTYIMNKELMQFKTSKASIPELMVVKFITIKPEKIYKNRKFIYEKVIILENQQGQRKQVSTDEILLLGDSVNVIFCKDKLIYLSRK